MFTGIVEEAGVVVAAERRGDVLRATIRAGAVLAGLVRGGSIAVTASLAGLIPYGGDPVYAASKHGVVGFVRSKLTKLDPRLRRRGRLRPAPGRLAVRERAPAAARSHHSRM